MLKIHKEILFPTPIYVTDFGNSDLIKDIKNLVLREDEVFSDSICYSTADTLHLNDSFAPLLKLLDSYIEFALNDIGVLKDSYKITCMWANISESQNRHNMHLHPNSFLSGVLYLNCPENPGNIGFRDPRHSMEMISFEYAEDSIFRHRTIEVEPITGRLILFPSWLQHGTRPGDFIEDKRISLSFNVMPICSVNDYGRRMEFC